MGVVEIGRGVNAELDGLSGMVTGATQVRLVLINGVAGIGLETAKELARRGARVLLACRDPVKGQQALVAVRVAATAGATVELLSLDLASFESVRACASKVLAKEQRLDILVNNAGGLYFGTKPTIDGLFPEIQVNHLGSFLLTLLLIDLMKKSAPSRVIFVSTLLHRFVSMDPEHLEYTRARQLFKWQVHCVSKLASVVTAKELARRLKDTGVTVNSLHPGITRTNVFRSLPLCGGPLVNLFTSIFCKEARMSTQAFDWTLAKAVWKKSENLVGLRDDERPVLAV
ncbi:Alcohol dehydrogenase [Gryllus bimaculatus]|nr:Alcohol dehydrogenase [Gryllus bimaculatus]